MVHILHHNDADGYAAGYVAKKYFSAKTPDIKLYEMDYSKETPLDKINPDDTVVIVDFSLEPQDMIKLLKITKDVIWIDHHISAIKRYYDWEDLIKEASGLDNIPGMRVDGVSGCALTYLYFRQVESYVDDITREDLEEDLDFMPIWLRLIDDWDVWRHKIPDSKPFIIALNTMLTMDTMEKLDEDSYEIQQFKTQGHVFSAPVNKADMERLPLVQELISMGNNFIKYRDSWSEGFRKKYGFSTEVTGPDDKVYSMYCMNIGNSNSEYFGDKIHNYDVLCTFAFNGDKFTYSMYSEKPEVDCSSLCRYFGVDNGGGHRGAAGFTHKDMLFRK